MGGAYPIGAFGGRKDIMEMVRQMICNVAITNKSVRAIVHRAGGLSIAVKMLQSKMETVYH